MNDVISSFIREKNIFDIRRSATNGKDFLRFPLNRVINIIMTDQLIHEFVVLLHYDIIRIHFFDQENFGTLQIPIISDERMKKMILFLS
jgi:hypothetical protein